MKRKLCRCIAFLIVMLAAISLPAWAQKEREVSPDEYKVYEAALGLMDQVPKPNPHVTIFNVTLNSKCGEDAYPSPLANGCSFLWITPETANDVQQLLRGEWANLENSTWSDFENKNAESVHLHDPISTPWKHKLVGNGDEPVNEWKSPDLTIFLSRVGFNQKKTEAVVYVLIFSYMDQLATAGDYFLFRADKSGHWQPNGRITYFRTEDQSQQ